MKEIKSAEQRFFDSDGRKPGGFDGGRMQYYVVQELKELRAFYNEAIIAQDHEPHCNLRFPACKDPCDCKLSKVDAAPPLIGEIVGFDSSYATIGLYDDGVVKVGDKIQIAPK